MKNEIAWFAAGLVVGSCVTTALFMRSSTSDVAEALRMRLEAVSDYLATLRQLAPLGQPRWGESPVSDPSRAS
jgi:hypothetical protein